MFNNNLTYYITKELSCLSSFLQCLLCYIATQFSLCGNLASPALTLLHFTPVQPPADLRPRGASCWNNNSRSGLRSACHSVCQAENGAESGRCRCCRHIFPTHSRDRILGRDIIRKNTTNHSSLISVPGQTSPRDSGGLLPGREVHVLAARGRLLVCREHRQ